MPDNEIPKPRKLANKPLVEAIFELRWQLKVSAQGIPPHDPGFRIALGKYYDNVRKNYPVMVDLPTTQIPEDMTAYAVRHQFRAAENQWPLTQLGPGILSVNETQGYTWGTFEPRLQAAVGAIYASYPSEIYPFKPTSVQLRYIDAIELDAEKSNPVTFLREYLHTNIQVDPRIDSSEEPAKFRLNLTFPLSSPIGVGVLSFASGVHQSRPAIILDTSIRSDGDDAPKKQADFAAWFSDAHAVVERWFFTLCRGKLLERFEKAKEEKDAKQN